MLSDKLNRLGRHAKQSMRELARGVFSINSRVIPRRSISRRGILRRVNHRRRGANADHIIGRFAAHITQATNEAGDFGAEFTGVGVHFVEDEKAQRRIAKQAQITIAQQEVFELEVVGEQQARLAGEDALAVVAFFPRNGQRADTIRVVLQFLRGIGARRSELIEIVAGFIGRFAGVAREGDARASQQAPQAIELIVDEGVHGID